MMIGIGISPHFQQKKSLLSYWTQQYQNVLDAMPTRPSDADRINQARLMYRLVDEGYYDKSEIIDIIGTPTADSSLINWKSPGTFNPSLVNAPAFTAYDGYKCASSGSKYIRTNFNPAANGTLISQDNIFCLLGVSDSVNEDRYDFGAYDGTTYTIFQSLASGGISGAFRCNSSGESNVTTNAGNKYVWMNRSAAATALLGTNGYMEGVSVNSNGLINKELFAGGWNNNNTATPSNKRVRCIIVMSALSKYQIGRLIDILDEYFSNYGTSLINNAVFKGDISTKQQITVPTSVADNNEVIHPSLLYFPTGWNGYKYWQANTPYPNSSATYERPEIYVSNDGINWAVPAGLTNPLFPTSDPGYSDVDLYFETDTLYLFYRYDVGASQIRVIKSTDGITWNTASPATVYNDGIVNFSPSIVKIGDTYFMYYRNYANGRHYRVRCATIDGTYDTVENCLAGGAQISSNHLSALQIGAVTYLAVGNNSGIYVLKSDDGVNFTKDHTSCPTVWYNKSWEGTTTITVFYRPDLVEIDGALWCYYSVHAGAGLAGNYMGRIKIDIL